MDEKFGKEHERIVLEEFDKIKENFGTKKSSNPETDVPISLEDIFGSDTGEVFDALQESPQEQITEASSGEAEKPSEAIQNPEEGSDAKGRLSRLQAEKVQAGKKPAGEKLSEMLKGLSAGFLGIVHGLRSKAAAGGSIQGQPSAEQQTEAEGEGVGEMKKKKSFSFGRKSPKGRTRQRKYRINWKKFLKFALILGGIGVLFVAVVILLAIKDAPQINPGNIYDLLTENSIIYDEDGEVVDNVYAGDALRTNIEFNQLPENLVDAFVSIEDKTFFTHNGFNVVRIFGAIWHSVTSGEKISGTSTITQQLARNLYLTETKSKRSMVRKIKEAYYTLVIEDALSKEQILEAYMNTIYLGFNSNGVQSASQAYFSKDVEELSLIECALLASLPQSPNAYAPIKRLATGDVEDFDALDIIDRNDSWTTYYNPDAEDRILLTLYFMHEQGKITDEEYEAAKITPIRDSIDPGSSIIMADTSSFFADFVVKNVIEDLSNEYGMDEAEASDLIYNGGLQIYSTLSLDIQGIVEEEYDKTSNFPAIGYATKDKNGNILDSTGKVLLYSMATFFNEDADFVMSSSEYKWNDDGSLLIYKGKRLNIYKTSVKGETDYSVEFKNFYETVDGIFYSRAGGVWTIAKEYKDRDADGNLIISAQFFSDHPGVLFPGENDTLILDAGAYILKQAVMQPQSAMVIMDYENGHIKAMMGGRGIDGRMLYNRATAPRQPGSAIKPLSVYAVALQSGVNGTGSWNAASPIDDAPMKYGGAAWPKNWYEGYTGINTLRNAVEQSINACAVNLWMQLDPQMAVDFLNNMGITTLVEYGTVNDINAAALALGGMTAGISPLEMTGAYGTFGNNGTYIEPICYTSVTNKAGDILLSNDPITHEVMDPSVSSLMTDILLSTVNNGIASGAKIASQPVAGKTGTTSERYDVWFCGLTPQYSAALWIGNDVNIPMNQGSGAASSLWSRIMQRVCADLPREEFQMTGEFVSAQVDRLSGKLPSQLSYMDPRGTVISEIFIAGTVPTELDDAHVMVSVCADTGYLATPYCMDIVNKLAVIRPGKMSWEKMLSEYKMDTMTLQSLPDAIYDAPDFYCPIHNPEPGSYPVSPFASQSTGNNWLIPQEPEPPVDEPVPPEEGQPVEEEPNPGEENPEQD